MSKRPEIVKAVFNLQRHQQRPSRSRRLSLTNPRRLKFLRHRRQVIGYHRCHYHLQRPLFNRRRRDTAVLPLFHTRHYHPRYLLPVSSLPVLLEKVSMLG